MNKVMVDTSVWVDHFRQPDGHLVAMLVADRVLVHPMVLGELACGTPPNRADTLATLAKLQPGQRASLRETMEFIDRERLFGLGCGLADLMLLASTMMTPATTLWTLDKRLGSIAERYQVRHREG